MRGAPRRDHRETGGLASAACVPAPAPVPGRPALAPPTTAAGTMHHTAPRSARRALGTTPPEVPCVARRPMRIRRPKGTAPTAMPRPSPPREAHSGRRRRLEPASARATAASCRRRRRLSRQPGRSSAYQRPPPVATSATPANSARSFEITAERSRVHDAGSRFGQKNVGELVPVDGLAAEDERGEDDPPLPTREVARFEALRPGRDLERTGEPYANCHGRQTNAKPPCVRSSKHCPWRRANGRRRRRQARGVHGPGARRPRRGDLGADGVPRRPIGPVQGDGGRRTRDTGRACRADRDRRALRRANGSTTRPPVATSPTTRRRGPTSFRPSRRSRSPDEDSPAFLPGGFTGIVAAYVDADTFVDAFRTGRGVGWHEHDRRLFVGTERLFRPGYKGYLVSDWIPKLDGVDVATPSRARMPPTSAAATARRRSSWRRRTRCRGSSATTTTRRRSTRRAARAAEAGGRGPRAIRGGVRQGLPAGRLRPHHLLRLPP